MSSDPSKSEQIARQGTQQQLNTDIYEEMIAKDRKINIDEDSLEHQVGDMSTYSTKEFTNVPGLDRNPEETSSSRDTRDSKKTSSMDKRSQSK